MMEGGVEKEEVKMEKKEGLGWTKEVGIVGGRIREREGENRERIKEKVESKGYFNDMNEEREGKENGGEGVRERIIRTKGKATGTDNRGREKETFNDEEEMKAKETEVELNETRILGLIEEEKNWKHEKGEMDLFERTITLEKMT